MGNINAGNQNSRCLNSQMKWIALFSLYFSAYPSAFAQVQRGTIVIGGYSKDKVFMVADSRAWHTDPFGYYDSDCKIAALGDKAAVASVNVSAYQSHNPSIKSWDAFNEARESFLPFIQDRPNSTFQASIEDWRHRVFADLRAWIEKDPHDLLIGMDGDEIMAGIFIGIAADGEPIMEVVNFSCPQESVRKRTALGTNGITMSVWKASLQNAVTFEAYGRPEVFNEFSSPKTPRALREADQWRGQRPTSNVNDLDVLQAIRWADLTVALQEQHPIKGQLVYEVGGEIDAVEFAKGGKLQWIQRKPNCPAN